VTLQRQRQRQDQEDQDQDQEGQEEQEDQEGQEEQEEEGREEQEEQEEQYQEEQYQGGREVAARLRRHSRDCRQRSQQLDAVLNTQLQLIDSQAAAASSLLVAEAEAKLRELRGMIKYVTEVTEFNRKEIRRKAARKKQVVEKEARRVLEVMKARNEEELWRLRRNPANKENVVNVCHAVMKNPPSSIASSVGPANRTPLTLTTERIKDSKHKRKQSPCGKIDTLRASPITTELSKKQKPRGRPRETGYKKIKVASAGDTTTRKVECGDLTLRGQSTGNRNWKIGLVSRRDSVKPTSWWQ
jgi:hypothetical protein